MLRFFLRASLLSLLGLLTFASSSSLAQQAPLALEGHTDTVTSAGYSPDGKLILTGSYDRNLGIFNAADGELLRTLAGHTGQVFSVAVSPNGRQALSASRDGTAKIWDLYIPTPLAQLPGHEQAVQVVEIASDGQWFLTGSADMALKLWQRSDGELLFDLKGHEAAVSRAAIKADNSQVASGDANGMIRLWDPAEGEQLAELGAHTAEITGIAYDPTSDTLLTSAADGVVKLWALPAVAPQILGKQETGLAAVAISPDAKLLATATAEGNVQLYDGETGEVGLALEDQPGPVTSLAMTEDGALLASASETGVVKLWNTADGADKLTLQGHAGPVHDVRFSADGMLLVTAGEDGTVRLWRQPQSALALAGHTMPVRAVEASSDGKILATAAEDKTVRLFNAADATSAGVLEGHTEGVTDVALTADSTQVASGDEAGAIHLWSVAEGASVAQLYGPAGPVTGLEYGPDGKTLYSTSQSGALTWWQLPPTAPVPLAGHAVAVSHLAVTPDGQSIVTGSADGALGVFATADGEPVRKLAGQEGSVTALANSDALVVAGSENGLVRLWNLADGEAQLPLAGHEGTVTSLAIHSGAAGADAVQIVSAGDDGVIRFWKRPTEAETFPGSDLAASQVVFSDDRALVASAGIAGGKPSVMVRNTADGALQGTLLGHEGAVTTVTFSADNKKIATGSADKTARVWDLTDPKFPEIAKFEGHEAGVTAVAFSTDGGQVFSGDAANHIKQWTVAEAEEAGALSGHTDAITALEVAGPTLVSASADQTIRTWNIANGTVSQNFSHGAAVTALAVSADGKQIAAGGADKSIKIFPAAGGEATASLDGCAAAVKSLAFNAEGTQVVACSTDGTRLWDTAGLPLERFAAGAEPTLAVAFAANSASILSGDAKHVLHAQPISFVSAIAGHEGAVSSLAYSSDGTHLFSAGADKTVRRWNVADGKPLDSFAGPTDAVTALSLAADGNRLVAGSVDKNVYAWPVAAPAAQPVAADATYTLAEAVQAVSAGADGARIAAAGDDNLVTVWDAACGQVLERLTGHDMPVLDVRLIGEQDDTVVSASADKTAVVHKLAAVRVIAAAEGAVHDLALAADGTLAAPAGADSKLTLINTEDGSVVHTMATDSVPQTVALRGDKTQVAAGLDDMNLSLWPLTDEGPGEAVAIELPAAATNLDYHDESGKLAVVAADGNLRVYDSAGGHMLEQIVLSQTAADVAFLPDGMQVVAAAEDGGFAQPLSLRQRIAAHEGAATGVAVTADNTAAISGGADKLVRMWNLEDGTEMRTFAGPQEAIVSLDLSADGKFLGAAVADNQLLVWDLSEPAAEQPAAPLTTIAQPEATTQLSMAADGSLLAAAGADGVVRVWEAASGRQLQRFQGHEEAVAAVDFAADNQTILSGGADGTARLWKISATRLLAADETRVGDVAFLPDGSQFVTVGNEMLVKFWDAEGTLTKQLEGATAALGRMALRPDAAQLAAADAEGNVLLWTLADGALTHTVETAAAVHDLAYSPEGAQLAAAAADNHLRVYLAEDATLLQDQTAADALLAARFAPEGQEIITGSADNTVSTWAYANPESVGELTGHTGAVYSVAYNMDGTQAATCGADGTVRLWDAATGEEVKAFAGHEGPVYTVRFVSEDKQLLSAGIDGTARLWNVDSGQVVQTLAPTLEEGETVAPLFDAAANAQGTLIATAGSDRQIRLWNAANGQLNQTLAGHADPIYRLDFLANQLLSIGQAGNLHVWNPANGAQTTAVKLPGVSFSSALSPDGTKLVIVCADAKAYVIDSPQ